jgi:hypothetical protein
MLTSITGRHIITLGGCTAVILACNKPSECASTIEKIEALEKRLKLIEVQHSRTTSNQLIDHKTYPLVRGSPGYDEFVCAARKKLSKNGCFRLPGFVTPEGVAAIKRECLEIINTREVLGNQVGRAVNCYYTAPDESLADSHPVNTLFDRSFGAIRDDMIGSNHTLRSVYDDKQVIGFVADVLGVPTLYQSRDSYQALTVNVMENEENLHWHFDCNACAITLGIQVPESGGELEFIPRIGRKNFASIEQVLSGNYHRTKMLWEEEAANREEGSADDSRGSVVSYEYETGEGDLVFFCGGQSIHRVRAVGGDRLRLVAALQFHTSDDAFDPPDMTHRIYGVHPDEHIGPKLTVVSSE